MAVPIRSIFNGGDYEKHVAEAAGALRDGRVVMLPTETVYGAAALLTRPEARQKLRSLRNGNAGGAFTVHLARPTDADRYVDRIGDHGRRLIRKLWPGPVALGFAVSESHRLQTAAAMNLPESDLYNDAEITLRCPEHPVVIDVLSAVDGPIALTAAGGSAAAPNWRPEPVASELEGKVDLILDAGPTKYSKPSTILRVFPDHHEIIRAGVYDERIIERLLRTTILFVCSGNTCRSPMAEAIARHILAEKLSLPEPELEKKGISVVSAGASAMPGSRATPQAVEAVRDLGADLSHHRSRPLTVELIHQADVIFTMSRNHAHVVTALVPGSAEKVNTLDPDGDIEDPIGGDAELYQHLAGHLRELIGKRLEETVIL